MAKVKFTKDMFPSETSIDTKKHVKEATAKDEQWDSYWEFIAFCIGKHSTLVIFVHFLKLNFVQDLIIYILVGIPVCYMQLILGQYTNIGIFLIRRMLPLAQGITYTYFMTIFTLTIIIVTEMETNLIYFILTLSPSKLVWNLCPPKYEQICWDFSKLCTAEQPCVNASIQLPTYLFWNQTYMGGAFPLHKAKFGIPDYRRILVTFICWLFIYFLTILKFRSVKKSVQILVALSVVAKVIFALQYGSALSYSKLISTALTINSDTWLSTEAWASSISRVISSMMLGDFTYIMFGVYATYTVKTGSLSFIGAICGYAILFLEIILLKGAVLTLVQFSKIDPTDAKWFFPEHVPVSLTILPASLGILNRGKLWVFLYFFTNVITYLAWCVINITFMQQSLYQRFAGMQSYYKYVCPAFCLVGFTFGVFVQTKEIYEIRFDLTMAIDSFCQHLNLILLTVMIVYIYGFRRLGDDIQFMTGRQPADYWKVTWVMSPIIMMLSTPTTYWHSSHPFFTIRVCTIAIVFLPVLIFGVVVTMRKVYHRDILGLLKSDPLWGPIDERMRTQRNAFQPRKQTKYKTYQQQCPHQCLQNNPVYYQVVVSENYNDQYVLNVMPP